MGGIFSAAEVAEVEEQIIEFVKNEQPQLHGKKKDPSDPKENVLNSEVPNIPEDEVRDDPNSIDSGEELLKQAQSIEVEGSKKEIKDYRERMDEFYASLDKVQKLVAQLKTVKDDTEREKLLAVLRKEKQILLEKKRSGYFMIYKTPTANDQGGFYETIPELQRTNDSNQPNLTKQTHDIHDTRQKSNSTSQHTEAAQAGSQVEKEQILEVFGVVAPTGLENPTTKSCNTHNNNNIPSITAKIVPSKRVVLTNWRNPLHFADSMPHSNT